MDLNSGEDVIITGMWGSSGEVRTRRWGSSGGET